MESNEREQMFERMILSGLIEPAGMDSDSGEMLFSFTEKLIEVSPELALHIEDTVVSTTMTLWSEGFVDLRYSDDAEQCFVSLTDKSMIIEEIERLSDFEQSIIANIKRLYHRL